MYNSILKHNNDLWVSQDFLAGSGISEDYIRVAKLRSRQGSPSWKHETIQNKCYFRYSTLPRTAANKLPDVAELAQAAVEEHGDVVNIISRAVYSTFKLFLKNMSEEEARSAAVLHEASIYVKNSGISYSKSHFFEQLAAEIAVQKLKYLPTTWRNLRDKIRAYSQGKHISDLVYAKNKKNSNRSLFANNRNLQSWLIDLGESGKNFSSATIFRKIRLRCEQEGMSAPSQRWISDWLNNPSTQFLVNQRYGSGSRFNQNYRIYTPTASAMYAGDCWELDGTRVNIISHSVAVADSDGKRKRKDKYLYIIAVRDVMSGHILGWEYCYEESATAVINALAMAAGNAGYLPYELRYDKFPGHNSGEWTWLEGELRKKGVTMTQTVKAEGKAHIERWWGTLQDVFMSESDFYYGEGVRSSRRYAHRSKEYIKSMQDESRKRGFNFDDACRETDRILSAYVSTPFSHYSRKHKHITQSPSELHNSCTHPYSVSMDYPSYCRLFGLRKSLSIRNYMIRTEIYGATYFYGIDDAGMAEHYTGIKIEACFDLDNLDQVHLFDLDGQALGSFRRITPAQQYGPQKDMRAVGRMKAIDKQVKSLREQRRAALQTGDSEAVIADEVGVLLAGKTHKYSYEEAESNFLISELEDEELKIDIRNHY